MNKDVSLKKYLPSYNQYSNPFGKIQESFALVNDKYDRQKKKKANDINKRTGSMVIGIKDRYNGKTTSVDLSEINYKSFASPDNYGTRARFEQLQE